MYEHGFEFEDNDFGDLCGLADIFPDIEPYLEDVTNSYEIAKADTENKKCEGHIDGSDSDSGISADSFANGVFKNLDSSIKSNVVLQDKLPKSIKVTTTIIPENKFISNTFSDNKILIKRPVPFHNETKPPIYNIIPKILNCHNQKSKPIFFKSHSVCSNFNEDNKKVLSKPISKITPIKLMKSNDGFPIMVNDCVSNSNIENRKGNYITREITNVKIEMNSSCNLFSSVNSKKDNIFLKDDLIDINDDISLITDFHETDIHDNKTGSRVDLASVNDLKSQDCQSYLEIFNSNQDFGNKIFATSSTYNTNNNSDIVLDTHHYDRMVKKQERMIKNRQAASLSRQRKKEYVERLEHKVEQQKQENQYIQSQMNDIRERFCALEQENQILKRDNQTWRDRYYDLERQKIKQGIATTNNHCVRNSEVNNKIKALKATAVSTTILGFFIICTLNFSSLNLNMSSIYKSQNEKDIPIYKNNYPIQNAFLGNKILGSENRLSRTLFSTIENSSVTNGENLSNNICNNTSGLNISETLRLTRELNRWGSRFKAESVKVYDRLQNEKIKSQILSKEIESMFKKSKIRDIPIITNKIKRKRDSASGQLEIYLRNNDYGFFDSFINDIDRNPDTLYFVTFHSDNLIFPASNMNKNLSTPKITLFLPADINQKDQNFYKMMKIDCQVQNFTIVNLRKFKLT